MADIQELFGSHYELPELGPLGSNGMALPRDFEHPVASFDMDTSEWESKYHLNLVQRPIENLK
jgi:homogentisate 1,2-dioxygenase